MKARWGNRATAMGLPDALPTCTRKGGRLNLLEWLRVNQSLFSQEIKSKLRQGRNGERPPRAVTCEHSVERPYAPQDRKLGWDLLFTNSFDKGQQRLSV